MWDKWVNEVTNKNYFSTEMDRLNALKFSPFMISHKIATNVTDQGVCMVSYDWGAVCLLSNDNYDGMVTYRLGIQDWYDIGTSSPT